MIESKFYRFLSLLMALLIFVSSTGFAIDLHFCQGKVKTFSFVGEAPSCHEMMVKKHCGKHQLACHVSQDSKAERTIHNEKNCCSNKTIIIESNDDAKTLHKEEIVSKTVIFIKAFIQVFFLEKIDFTKSNIPYKHYKPPLLDKDIPILIQSFLL